MHIETQSEIKQLKYVEVTHKSLAISRLKTRPPATLCSTGGCSKAALAASTCIWVILRNILLAVCGTINCIYARK